MTQQYITAEVDPLVLLAAANAAHSRYSKVLAEEKIKVAQLRSATIVQIMHRPYWFFFRMTRERAEKIYTNNHAWRWGHFIENHHQQSIDRCARIAYIASQEALHAIRLGESDITLLGENLSTGEVAA